MSQRTRALVEVVTGILGMFGYIWLISPLYHLWVKVVVVIPILAFLMFANMFTNTRLKDLGFRWDTWTDSAKILGLFTVITIPVLYGLWKLFFPVNPHFYADANFWKRLLVYPLWALFQEYLVLGFFFRRYRDIFSPYTSLAVVCSACTFSLMHIPTPPLLILCFVSGLVWAGTYHRYPNLYTIAISHAILGAFCLQVLWMYGTVGPDADIGRWSKKQPPSIQGAIVSVNARPLGRKERLIHISQETTRLVVEGWVVTRSPMEDIHLSLGGRHYAVEYGAPRQDLVARFPSPEYRLNGFHATIPLHEVVPGYHPLVLVVSLQHAFFQHSPGKTTWISRCSDK